MVENMMTPEEFRRKMVSIVEEYGENGKADKEELHIQMDDAMADLLVELGYKDGVAIFWNTPVWYA